MIKYPFKKPSINPFVIVPYLAQPLIGFKDFFSIRYISTPVFSPVLFNGDVKRVPGGIVRVGRLESEGVLVVWSSR